MLYKTMILELLRERPAIHDQLRSQRMLLPTLERLAIQLRTSHLTWKDLLSQAKPGSSESQIASEAREIALQELADSLPPACPPDADEPLSLDAAMAFLLHPSHPG